MICIGCSKCSSKAEFVNAYRKQKISNKQLNFILQGTIKSRTESKVNKQKETTVQSKNK
jgi:hypothetical protein